MNVNDARRAEIVRLVQSIAQRDGVAPGQKKFASETGIQTHTWRGKFWRGWGEALVEAGYAANDWIEPIDQDAIIAAVATLARQQGRFPTGTDLSMERTANPNFPALRTITRTRTMQEVANLVRDYAVRTEDGPLATMADTYLANFRSSAPKSDDATDGADAIGHVYLIRYGKDFKIGRTGSVVRRSRQVQVELPDATELVHSILTDDPSGVEAYWHRRFVEYRGNGEWFRLPPRAVNAFKKWTKII